MGSAHQDFDDCNNLTNLPTARKVVVFDVKDRTEGSSVTWNHPKIENFEKFKKLALVIQA